MKPPKSASRDGTALRASLADRGFAYSRIVGDSMIPSLRTGDIVLLEPCDMLRPGDIATFELDGSLVTHRVLSIGAAGVVCRGDHRLGTDRPVERAAVIARVTEVVGRSLPVRTRDLLRVRLHRLELELATRLSRVRDEGTLIFSSAAGRSTGEGLAAAPALGLASSSSDTHAFVLDPLEATDGDSLRLGQPEGIDPVIPAHSYGGLSAAQRRDAMQAARGHRVHVYALPLAFAGRVTRFSAHIRRFLLALGFRAGEPGDMAVRDSAGLHTVHTFTACELELELERFGLGPVTVETVATDAGPLLRATAGPADSVRPGQLH